MWWSNKNLWNSNKNITLKAKVKLKFYNSFIFIDNLPI